MAAASNGPKLIKSKVLSFALAANDNSERNGAFVYISRMFMRKYGH